MSGLHVDWASLALVTVVTVTVTALVMLIVSLAARMLGEVRLKREAGRAQGLHAAEVAAGFFLLPGLIGTLDALAWKLATNIVPRRLRAFPTKLEVVY